MSEIMEQDDEVKIREKVQKLTADIKKKLEEINEASNYLSNIENLGSFSAQVAKLTEEIGDKLEAIKGASDYLCNSDNLAKKIGDKLAAVQGASDDLSIYRVPNKLRKVKADAYNPRLVSIGPFHRGNTDLASMVEHKWRYLLYFVQRPKDFETTRKCLVDCTVSLYNLNQKIRRCYAEKMDDDHDKDKLTELLLLDGCFVLELFLRHEERCSNMKLKGKIDPIFNNAWMIPALRQDLALLENQIPFFVLKELYCVIKPHINNFTPPDSVTSLALKFFQPMENHESLLAEDRDTEDCNHLLDLLHKLYLLPSLKSIPNGGDHRHISINLTIQSAPLQNQIISTVQTTSHLLRTDASPAASGTGMNKGFSKGASQLLESGVQLQKGSPEDHLLDITFDNGLLKIPPIFIGQTTDSLFRNFIAFEQCHLKGSHQITSYAILMKSLICSKEDIKLLQNTEILHQIWTEDKDLIDFGNIFAHVHPKDFCYGKLCQEVKAYSKSFHWHKLTVSWKVRLRRYIRSFYMKYFSNPWSMIAFLAAVTVFGLTVTQTYYTIHSR